MTLDPSTIEELTAYLDGELEPAEIQRVEQRLDQDPEYLAEMQSLQQTWELFDRLPTTEASSAFTRTTMELVVDDAVKQINRSRKKWWIFPVRLAVLIGLPLLLFAISYGLTHYNLDRPNRELISNLPLIENYDQYIKVDCNLEFLTQLLQNGYFSDDDAIYTNPQLSPDIFRDDVMEVENNLENLQQREQRIESLDIDQKNALRRKYTEFEKFTAEQRERLRSFFEQLSSHPQRVKLTRVMNEYYVWLTTLNQQEQARLLDLDPAKRLAEIGRIKTRQDREAFGRYGATALPTARDAEWLFDWLELTVSTNERTIRNRFPEIASAAFKQKGFNTNESSLQKFAKEKPIKTILALLFRIDRKSLEDIILEDVDLLRPNLSYEALAILDDQSPEGQKELILNWIASANQSKSTISVVKLKEFFDQLPQYEKDELDDMDSESWLNAVKQKYQKSRRSRTRAENSLEDEWDLLLQDVGIDFN